MGRNNQARAVTPFEIYRRQHRLSQIGLGRLTQIPSSRISLIERGEMQPTRPEIESLSKFFGISVEQVQSLVKETVK